MSANTVHLMAQWIECNIEQNPTLVEMSKSFGYSSYYCSSKFHEYMGITYKQYLSYCRLKNAANDIINSKDRLIEIAFRYGYSSQESLTRAFKAAFQCSPREFRKQISL